MHLKLNTSVIKYIKESSNTKVLFFSKNYYTVRLISLHTVTSPYNYNTSLPAGDLSWRVVDQSRSLILQMTKGRFFSKAQKSSAFRTTVWKKLRRVGIKLFVQETLGRIVGVLLGVEGVGLPLTQNLSSYFRPALDYHV